MARAQHSRALRQIIGDLVDMAPSERDEIMALLTPEQRLRVRKLATGIDDGTTMLTANALVEAGLSRKLAELVSGSSPERGVPTAGTQSILYDCAKAFFGRQAETARNLSPSLAQRIGGLFRQGGGKP